MAEYITTIANRETIFTEDTIKIGHLVLEYNKMSNVKYRKGTKPGFIFDYENRNIFLPCGEEEKSAMMPLFQKVALLDRQRKEEEERKRREEEERRRQEEEQRRLEEERRRQEEEMLRKQREEQDALDTLDFLTEGMIDPEEPVEPEVEVETPSVTIEESKPEMPKRDPLMTLAYGPSVDSPYYNEGDWDFPKEESVVNEPESKSEPKITLAYGPFAGVSHSTEEYQDEPMTDLYGPSVDSPYYNEKDWDISKDNLIDGQISDPELLQLYNNSHGFVAQSIQEESAPMEMPAMSIPSMENNFVEPEPLEIIQSVQQSTEPEPIQNDIFKPGIAQQAMTQQIDPELSKEIDDVLLQKDFKPQLKSFWKIGRLVTGIISIVLFGLMGFNLYHTGVINTLINYGHINNYSGLILAITMLIGGIVGAATSGSKKKIGCIISSVIYFAGTIIGGLNWMYSYIDGKIATIVLAVFALFYLFCAIKNPTKKIK